MSACEQLNVTPWSVQSLDVWGPFFFFFFKYQSQVGVQTIRIFMAETQTAANQLPHSPMYFTK